MGKQAIPTFPDLGSEEFWKMYDEFCDPTHLENFIENGASHLSPMMCKIMEASHRSRAYHRLSRIERGWKDHKAWLTLRDAPIRNLDGVPTLYMHVGDIIVVEWGWDRDVIITHTPINRNKVSGYLLSGKWEEMIGLFMPLFDRRTIMKCIEVRTAKNVRDALELADEEARDWHWY